MKSKLIIGILSVMIGFQTQAQHYFLGTGFGYSTPYLKQGMGTNSTYKYYNGSSSSYSESSYSVVYGNFGSGGNFGIHGGYELKNGMSFIAGFNIYATPDVTSKSEDYTYSNGVLSSSTIRDFTFKTKLSTLSFGIQYKYAFPNFEAYLKSGILIGVASFEEGFITHDNDYQNSFYHVQDQTMMFEFNPSIGNFTSIGVSKKLSNKLSVYVEMNINTLSFKPSKSKLTKDNLDGVDQLPTMTTYDKETIYENSISDNSNSTPDTSKPRKDIFGGQLNYSSIGLNIGITYKL